MKTLQLIVASLLVSSMCLSQIYNESMVKGKRYKAYLLTEDYFKIDKTVYKKTDVLFYFSKDGKTLYTSESPTQLRKFKIDINNPEPPMDVPHEYAIYRTTDRAGNHPGLYVINDLPGDGHDKKFLIIILYGNIRYAYNVSPTNEVPPGFGLEEGHTPLITMEYLYKQSKIEMTPEKLAYFMALKTKFLLDPSSVTQEDVDKLKE